MMFPVFSKPKIFAICLVIVIVDGSDGELIFDLTVGIETIAKIWYGYGPPKTYNTN